MEIDVVHEVSRAAKKPNPSPRAAINKPDSASQQARSNSTTSHDRLGCDKYSTRTRSQMSLSSSSSSLSKLDESSLRSSSPLSTNSKSRTAKTSRGNVSSPSVSPFGVPGHSKQQTVRTSTAKMTTSHFLKLASREPPGLKPKLAAKPASARGNPKGPMIVPRTSAAAAKGVERKSSQTSSKRVGSFTEQTSASDKSACTNYQGAVPSDFNCTSPQRSADVTANHLTNLHARLPSTDSGIQADSGFDSLSRYKGKNFLSDSENPCDLVLKCGGFGSSGCLSASSSTDTIVNSSIYENVGNKNDNVGVLCNEENNIQSASAVMYENIGRNGEPTCDNVLTLMSTAEICSKSSSGYGSGGDCYSNRSNDGSDISTETVDSGTIAPRSMMENRKPEAATSNVVPTRASRNSRTVPRPASSPPPVPGSASSALVAASSSSTTAPAMRVSNKRPGEKPSWRHSSYLASKCDEVARNTKDFRSQISVPNSSGNKSVSQHLPSQWDKTLRSTSLENFNKIVDDGSKRSNSTLSTNSGSRDIRRRSPVKSTTARKINSIHGDVDSKANDSTGNHRIIKPSISLSAKPITYMTVKPPPPPSTDHPLSTTPISKRQPQSFNTTAMASSCSSIKSSSGSASSNTQALSRSMIDTNCISKPNIPSSLHNPHNTSVMSDSPSFVSYNVSSKKPQTQNTVATAAARNVTTAGTPKPTAESRNERYPSPNAPRLHPSIKSFTSDGGVTITFGQNGSSPSPSSSSFSSSAAPQRVPVSTSGSVACHQQLESKDGRQKGTLTRPLRMVTPPGKLNLKMFQPSQSKTEQTDLDCVNSSSDTLVTKTNSIHSKAPPVLNPKTNFKLSEVVHDIPTSLNKKSDNSTVPIASLRGTSVDLGFKSNSNSTMLVTEDPSSNITSKPVTIETSSTRRVEIPVTHVQSTEIPVSHILPNSKSSHRMKDTVESEGSQGRTTPQASNAVQKQAPASFKSPPSTPSQPSSISDDSRKSLNNTSVSKAKTPFSPRQLSPGDINHDHAASKNKFEMVYENIRLSFRNSLRDSFHFDDISSRSRHAELILKESDELLKEALQVLENSSLTRPTPTLSSMKSKAVPMSPRWRRNIVLPFSSSKNGDPVDALSSHSTKVSSSCVQSTPSLQPKTSQKVRNTFTCKDVETIQTQTVKSNSYGKIRTTEDITRQESTLSQTGCQSIENPIYDLLHNCHNGSLANGSHIFENGVSGEHLSPPNLTRELDSSNLNWHERKTRMDSALSWLKTELTSLREMDTTLINQFSRCQEMIDALKSQRDIWDGLSEEGEECEYWDDSEINEFNKNYLDSPSVSNCGQLSPGSRSDSFYDAPSVFSASSSTNNTHTLFVSKKENSSCTQDKLTNIDNKSLFSRNIKECDSSESSDVVSNRRRGSVDQILSSEKSSQYQSLNSERRGSQGQILSCSNGVKLDVEATL